MPGELPGLNARRLASLMRDAIARCELDLREYVVFTEAASGAYVVTPVLAAMAGARHVYAMTRSTRYGTVDEITRWTMELAKLVGAAEQIEIVTERRREDVARADIVTNSGHVRPLDARMISWMKSTAVIPLMYETWELRDEDVDLEACRRRAIRVTGTNERHPAVDVFSFLGMMAVKLLLDAGVAVFSSRILLLCDNPFAPYIERGLRSAGALVEHVAAVSDVSESSVYDAIVVSRTPRGKPALSAADLATIARRWPGAVVAVYWGDVDRAALREAGLACWPIEAPPAGHMGVLPCDVGPEPVVRLQCGSFRAAQALLQYPSDAGHAAHAFGQPI